MKLAMLTQWFDPEPGPASLPGVYARELVSRGHSVSVLTGFPNYPDGRLYPGYRIRRRLSENQGGIELTRVALYPNHDASAIGRVVNYLSFSLSATISGGGALRGADAVWVYNSPVTVTLPLLAHTRMGRIPFFLHVQDLWPDSLVNSGMLQNELVGRAAAKIVSGIVRLSERKSAAVGVSSRGLRDIILERHPGLDPSKIVYAPNPTNEQLFRPVRELRGESSTPDDDSGIVDVMYAGAVGEVQGLDTVLDAAAMLRDDPRIRISIVGDGISRARLQKRAAEEGISNVRFTGRVPQDAVPTLMARSQIQLVSLAPAPFLSYTTPSKISALLASEVPIIGHLAGDGARLVRDSGAGFVATPGDAAELASLIVKVANGGPNEWSRLGQNGRAYYDAHLSARSTTDTILRSLGGSTEPNRTSLRAEC